METYYKPVFLWEGRKPLSTATVQEVEETILANIHAFAQQRMAVLRIRKIQSISRTCIIIWLRK